MNTNPLFDKKSVAESVKAIVGDSFVKFNMKEGDPTSFAVGAYEDIEESKWRGKWYDRIKKTVYEKVPNAVCVCVNPLPIGKVVWYRVTVAV